MSVLEVPFSTAQRFVLMTDCKTFNVILRISMNMRDTTTGKLLWKATNWTAEDMFNNEIKGKGPSFLTPLHTALTLTQLSQRRFLRKY